MNGALLEKSLTALGKALMAVGKNPLEVEEDGEAGAELKRLAALVHTSKLDNPWFIPEFVAYNMLAWGKALQEEKVRRWLKAYPEREKRKGKMKRVGLVMAGNLPMVGLHDLLCVMASGHHALVKLSGQDEKLIPAVMDLLCKFYPALRDQLTFLPDRLTGFDAVIATGSNNTSRYFEYYFGKYPNIIRKNRNGIAVVHGDEPEEWYRKLADDIFLYYGMGCRNVSKLYIPEGFDIGTILPFFEHYRHLADHHKYFNNYEYQKSILMINGLDFHDNGFLLVRRSDSIASAVSVVHFEEYKKQEDLLQHIENKRDEIQCIVSSGGGFSGAVEAGATQVPELWDYADGVDTMEFLLKLM